MRWKAIEEYKGRFVLGADIGTHSIRVELYDSSGKSVYSTRRTYERIIDSEGKAEQDPELWWYGLCECLIEIETKTGLLDSVLSIGITHQRGTVVPVDRDGNALFYAICDSDTRCWSQIEVMKDAGEDSDFYTETGMPLFPFVGMFKILWFKETHPELFNRTESWYSPQDYLVRRLIGEERLSAGSLSRLGLLNIRYPKKSSEWVKRYIGIDYPRDERIIQIGDVLGEVTSSISGVCGMLQGAKVVACAGDQSSALVALGALEEGDLGVNLGTSFVASVIQDHPVFDESHKWTVELAVDGKWALDIGSGCGANVLDWFSGRYFPHQKADWKQLGVLAEEFYTKLKRPFAVPLFWNVVGEDHYGALLGLQCNTETHQIYLALLEGLAFELRHALSYLELGTGILVSSIAGFGGVSRDDLFMRLISDLFDVRVLTYETADASVAGAAITAAVGSGLLDSYTSCNSEENSHREWIPQKEGLSYWEAKYKQYLIIRNLLPKLDF